MCLDNCLGTNRRHYQKTSWFRKACKLCTTQRLVDTPIVQRLTFRAWKLHSPKRNNQSSSVWAFSTQSQCWLSSLGWGIMAATCRCEQYINSLWQTKVELSIFLTLIQYSTVLGSILTTSFHTSNIWWENF